MKDIFIYIYFILGWVAGPVRARQMTRRQSWSLAPPVLWEHQLHVLCFRTLSSSRSDVLPDDRRVKKLENWQKWVK